MDISTSGRAVKQSRKLILLPGLLGWTNQMAAFGSDFWAKVSCPAYAALKAYSGIWLASAVSSTVAFISNKSTSAFVHLLVLYHQSQGTSGYQESLI